MELESSQQSMVVHIKDPILELLQLLLWISLIWIGWSIKGMAPVIKSWHITMSIFKFYIILWVPLK